MATAISHRRGVMSDAHALFAKPALELGPYRVELSFRPGFISRHDHRLRIRRPDQPPPVAEEDAHAVDVDDVVLRPEMLHRLVDEPELLLLVDLDANLGRRHEFRHVRKRLLD